MIGQKTLSALAIAAMLLAPLNAQAADAGTQASIQWAQALYSKGDYSSAGWYFERLCRAQPRVADWHYWRANCLAKQYRGSDAVQEYRTCLSLGPSPTIARYCHIALQGYGVTADFDTGTGQPAAEQQAVWQIQKQIDEEKQHLQARSALDSQAEQRSGEAEAQRLLQESQELADRLKRPGGRGHLSQATIDQITAPYQEKALMARERAALQATEIQNDYARKQQDLEQSAANIAAQIGTAPTTSDGVVVQPLGTNLYVRNYQAASDIDPDRFPPPVPMLAEANRYPATKQKAVDPKLATMQRLPAKSAGAGGTAASPVIETKVSGRLVKPASDVSQ